MHWIDDALVARSLIRWMMSMHGHTVARGEPSFARVPVLWILEPLAAQKFRSGEKQLLNGVEFSEHSGGGGVSSDLAGGWCWSSANLKALLKLKVFSKGAEGSHHSQFTDNF